MHGIAIRRRARLLSGFAPQTAAAISRPSDLDIAEIRTFPVREPVSGVRYTIVRLKTRSGLTGWGETTATEDASLQNWIGQPATGYAAIGPDTPGGAALDIAMLDIIGKATKAPVFRVLGGPTRNKVRGLGPDFRALNVALPAPASRNQGKAYQIAVRSLVERRRAANTDFVLDAFGLLTPGDAASVAATVEHTHPLWFDEPCGPGNLETVRKISGETVVPLGFGRGITQPAMFQALLREGLVDVVRPDIAIHGISGCRRIAALAEPYYVAVAPNHFGGPITTAAALHIAASIPNFFIQHVPRPSAPEDQAMRAAIAGAGVEQAHDGFLNLPHGPGLGIEINESALEKYHAA